VFEDAIFHGRCLTNPAHAIRRKMRETMPAKRVSSRRCRIARFPASWRNCAASWHRAAVP